MSRFGYFMLTYVMVLFGIANACFGPLPRLVWNATASTPEGLYRVIKDRHFQVGELVAVAPPPKLADWLAVRHFLPLHAVLMKQVSAVEGARVCRAGLSIIIDGRTIAQARERDHLGRLLPVWTGCRTLGRADIFLMNAAVPDSLDGRYFGPLPVKSVVGRAEPIWTKAVASTQPSPTGPRRERG
jgi:conjugative transfer signal peptidase TraF